jgi:hypothetical protein
MSPHRKYVLAGVLLFVITGFLASTCSLPGPNYLKAQVVTAIVGTQLPLGSNQSQVVAFLKAHDIENSGYEGKEDVIFINAIIRDITWGFPGNADLQIDFRFEPGGKLAEYTIERTGTGP